MAVKGKSGKSKAKSRQSALREEFDRQSEEEEAAERAAFSTPGFSDDGELLTLTETNFLSLSQVSVLSRLFVVSKEVMQVVKFDQRLWLAQTRQH